MTVVRAILAGFLFTEAFGLGRKHGIGSDVLVGHATEFGEVVFQLFLPGERELEQRGQAGVLAAVDLLRDDGDQLLAGAHHPRELVPARRRRFLSSQSETQ